MEEKMMKSLCQGRERGFDGIVMVELLTVNWGFSTGF